MLGGENSGYIGLDKVEDRDGDTMFMRQFLLLFQEDYLARLKDME